ncbi:MAG: ATP-binding protein [Luteimonas sp.]|nr:ATP-binding protein [Luteimonas sp.]
MKALERERNRLQSAGILEDNLPYPFDVSQIDDSDSAKIAAMSLYVKDSEEKLRVLNELASRVESLITNINGKFSNKRIQLDKERGLIARIPGGDDLRIDQLSSGEQHEIVLLYNLLFRVAPNTLVLIDEPELSLHIAWQRKFLPELLEITASAGIDALVATHSPSIVGDRDDLMVALDADRDDIL